MSERPEGFQTLYRGEMRTVPYMPSPHPDETWIAYSLRVMRWCQNHGPVIAEEAVAELATVVGLTTSKRLKQRFVKVFADRLFLIGSADDSRKRRVKRTRKVDAKASETPTPMVAHKRVRRPSRKAVSR